MTTTTKPLTLTGALRATVRDIETIRLMRGYTESSDGNADNGAWLGPTLHKMEDRLMAAVVAAEPWRAAVRVNDANALLTDEQALRSLYDGIQDAERESGVEDVVVPYVVAVRLAALAVRGLDEGAEG